MPTALRPAMRVVVLAALVAAAPALAQGPPAPPAEPWTPGVAADPGAPCLDDEGEIGRPIDEAPPDCPRLPPRPPSAHVFVPFPEGARWTFAVERQSFSPSEPETRFDTLGLESWTVRGTTTLGGRALPLLHVVRTDSSGAVTDRARCAVDARVEALPPAFWERWEAAVRDDLAAADAATARRRRGGAPPDGPRPGPTASMLAGPQEMVSLRFVPLEGACPSLDAPVQADPMAGALSPVLVGADVLPAEALGVSAGEPGRCDACSSTLWLFAGGVGPYLRARHAETADGRVEDRFHRLVYARVGGVELGRPVGVGPDDAVDDVRAADEPTVAIVGAGPNPFRDRVTLRFTVPRAGAVWVDVYDVLGRRVSRASLGRRDAGPVEHEVDGRGLAAGVYVLRAEAAGSAAVHRVTRVR